MGWLAGAGAIAGGASAAPYAEPSTNLIYELLFCDKPELYRQNFHGEPAAPWATLFAFPSDISALRQIALDEGQESRVRALAFQILRTEKQSVPPKIYLGTIVEVGLAGGLDTLAVFADGSARYINHSGRVAVAEGKPNPFEQQIAKVSSTSLPIIAAIGPWEKARLPAPMKGNIRMTFLVSDGLYFGEGPMHIMQKEPMAAPLIAAATELLVAIVNHPQSNTAADE